jgi:hypothetical protein
MAEKDEKKLLKNTIEEERLQLCNMVRRLGSKLSGLMFTSGILVFGFSLFLLLVPPEAELSIRLSTIFTGALSFVGGLNLLCGLLLLLGEED